VAADELETDDAQRVDIRPGVDVPDTARLLGAHVVEGAEHLAGHSGGARFVFYVDARDTEVEHLRAAILLHEDVPGLQVAVDDPVSVGVFHGVTDPGQQLEPLAEVERPGVLQEGPAVHELHGQIGEVPEGALESARCVDLGNVGVPQPGEQLHLELEPLLGLRRDRVGAQDLEGDIAAGLVLLGEIDAAHPAGAEPAEDAEGADVSLGPGLRAEFVADRPAHGRLQAILERAAVVGCVLVETEEFEDLVAQFVIACAGCVDVRLPLGASQFTRVREDLECPARSGPHSGEMISGGGRGGNRDPGSPVWFGGVPEGIGRGKAVPGTGRPPAPMWLSRRPDSVPRP